MWTPDRLASALHGLDGHQQQPTLHTMAMTGLRRSEACALRWANVDLDAGTIEVVAGLTQTSGGLHLDEPKSKRSRRKVDLDDNTIAVLRALRQAELGERLLVGAGYRDGDFVFARPDGARWKPDSIGQAFRRIVADLELPRIALHDLRHTHATLMLATSTDLAELNVVSDRLGHATVGFTLTTYGHSLPGRQSAGAHRVANLVRRSAPRQPHASPPASLANRRTSS